MHLNIQLHQRLFLGRHFRSYKGKHSKKTKNIYLKHFVAALGMFVKQ